MQRANNRIIWLLSPALFVAAFMIIAYGYFGFASFLVRGDNPFHLVGGPTISNFARILGSFSELSYILDTLWISLILSISTLVIATPMAVVIVRVQRPWISNMLMLSVAVTFLSGGVTRAYSWLIILGNRGLLNLGLEWLGIVERPFRLLYNWFGVGISITHYLLPFAVFTLVGVVRNLNPSVEEAARSLGATRTCTFWLITIPVLLPGLMVTMTLVYSICLASFLFPLLLGGGKVMMVANLIYDRMFVQYDIPFAAATSVVFLICAFVVIWLMSKVTNQLKRLYA